MKKYNQFEIFRFIGGLAVIFSHVAYNVPLFKNIPVVLKAGPAWVFFFFCLSGFFLAYRHTNISNFDILSFYKTRIFKFYPIYFLSLLLLLFSTEIKWNILYNIFLIQSWFFTKPLTYNISAWYLSVLFFLILLFPFFLYLFRMKYFIWVVLVINIYTYYFFNYMVKFIDSSNSIKDLIYYNPIMYISSFTLGMLIYDKIKFFRKRKIYSVFVIMSILFLFILHNNFRIIFNPLITLSFVPLIVFLFLDNGIINKLLSNKFFVYLGSLSYSMYILHIPVFYVFLKFVRMDINKNLYIYLIIVLLLSNLTKYLIENRLYKHLCKKY